MTRTVTRYALLSAMIVVISLFFIVPVPATGGFVNLSDAGIYAVALLFGPQAGLIVGGLSGGMIDLFSGYPQWILFSLVIHGFQGYIVGQFRHKSLPKQAIGLILGAAILIIGYALATTLLYGLAAGMASILGNVIQSVVGVVLGIPLLKVLTRAFQYSYFKKGV